MIKKADTKEWFEQWFCAPYYEILYSNRDHSEAEKFIQILSNKLSIPSGSKILDLACGNGRHAIQFNKMGFDVTGLDLSPTQIEKATEFSNNNLHFYIHDIRNPFRINYFDIVVNLFTSIGYFNNLNENARVIKTASQSLNSNGKFVLDFFNADKVKNTLVPKEEIEKNGILFTITRSIENGFIIKNIHVQDGNKTFYFSEKVALLELEQFETFFNQAKLKIVHLWGDYQLNPFNKVNSNRLILVAEKKQ